VHERIDLNSQVQIQKVNEMAAYAAMLEKRVLTEQQKVLHGSSTHRKDAQQEIPESRELISSRTPTPLVLVQSPTPGPSRQSPRPTPDHQQTHTSGLDMRKETARQVFLKPYRGRRPPVLRKERITV
jgi:hypothetical protein